MSSPAPYNDAAAKAAAAAASGSATTTGPEDIWGLGKNANGQVFLGTITPPPMPQPGGVAVGPYAPGRGPRPDGGIPAVGAGPYSGSGGPGALPSGLAVALGQAGYGGEPQPKFITAEEAMQQLPRLWAADKAGYTALQQKLYRAGFYGPNPPATWGALDQDTVNAYRTAVLRAVQLAEAKTPVTFEELLAQDGLGPGQAKKPTPGFIAQYSDPQTVAGIAQRAAQTALGRNLDPAQVKAFVAEFHAAEQRWNASSKAAAQTSATGQDAQVTSAPSAEAAADQLVHRGGLGNEAAGNNLADMFGVLQQMVGGG